ncbi:MAG: GntR family transcriptional regulator [Verrucomicrobia bacterium]|nr:GntR family transcriptional regulator [Verrucomicrobiota bacterium]
MSQTKKTSESTGLAFKRKSLVEQIADTLRSSIRQGVWQDFLPTERSLCGTMQVSRPVLRRAIHGLQQEGWLSLVRGHPTRIVNPSHGRRSLSKPKRVIMLSCNPLGSLGHWFHVAMDEIRKEVYDFGHRLEFVVDYRLRRNAVAPVLRTLVQQYEADHWILISPPLAVQQWFQEHRLNAVVSGHTFPGINLPSVDIDLRAVTRHAAGIFLGLNHRKIVYLARFSAAAGDLAAEEGFTTAFQTQPDAVIDIIRHSGHMDQIRSRFVTLFAAPQKPTAILVSHAKDTLAVLTYLLGCKIRVPQDVSLISVQPDNVFERVFPSPAFYEYDPVKYARLICRLIRNPPSTIQPIRIIPSFYRGDTLARPGR